MFLIPENHMNVISECFPPVYCLELWVGHDGFTEYSDVHTEHLRDAYLLSALKYYYLELSL